MLDFIKRRRSIRKYTTQDVGDDKVRLVLEAAMAAPTAHNRQCWRFVVVRQTQLRDALAEVHEFAGAARQAPIVIAVCADRRTSPHWLADGCAAAENLLLAAAALGLGAVWVAVYPYDEHESFVRGALDIPEGIGVVCLIPLGHPAEHKSPRTRYDSNKVFGEKWGISWDGTGGQSSHGR